MSQVRTVTLRTDDDTLNFDALVANLETQNPGLSVTTWKKKGKHSKKDKEEVLESVA